jgi:hypothetical protein
MFSCPPGSISNSFFHKDGSSVHAKVWINYIKS